MTAAGVISITATLAPASYKTPSMVQTTVFGNSSALDIAATSPSMWLAQGATLGAPLKVRVLSSGASKSNTTVNYQILMGTGLLSSKTALTDANGFATVTLNVTSLASELDVSACVAPLNNPCQKFFLFAVAPAALQLEIVSGAGQMTTVGQAFTPAILRVTDSSAPPNPVLGAGVTFQSFVLRPEGDTAVDSSGEVGGGQDMPVILSSRPS